MNLTLIRFTVCIFYFLFQKGTAEKKPLSNLLPCLLQQVGTKPLVGLKERIAAMCGPGGNVKAGVPIQHGEGSGCCKHHHHDDHHHGKKEDKDEDADEDKIPQLVEDFDKVAIEEERVARAKN